MPRSLIEAYESQLGVSVLHAWGMTEMSPLGTVSKLLSSHADLPDHRKWDMKAKQGYAIGGVEMRIVNDAGDEPGLLKSPTRNGWGCKEKQNDAGNRVNRKSSELGRMVQG